MNILTIMCKEIKQNFRDKKAMAMMILFPIVLILISGTALSSNFDKSVAFKGTNVIYSTNGNGELIKGFNSLINNEKELDIKFIEAKNTEEGFSGVKDRNYSAFILIDSNDNTIKVYKNSKFNLNGAYVESIFNTFAQKYNVMIEIAKVNPTALTKISNESTPSFVKEISLVGNKKPRAIDYYAVSMLTLILMYSAYTSASSFNVEKMMKTGPRILIAPVRKYEVLIGRILGIFLITAFQAAIVLFFSKYILKVYWGEPGAMLPVLVVVSAEIIMAVSLGAGITFTIQNEQLSIALINTIIPFIVFLGGGYIPLELINSQILNNISKISPLKWVNDAIFEVIYNNNFSIVPKALVVTLTISIIFITAASLMYRKEAA